MGTMTERMMPVWIESEHAVAFAGNAPAAEGHIVVVPREHVPSIPALPIVAPSDSWMGLRRLSRRHTP